jgi:hypothetical protein
MLVGDFFSAAFVKFIFSVNLIATENGTTASTLTQQTVNHIFAVERSDLGHWWAIYVVVGVVGLLVLPLVMGALTKAAVATCGDERLTLREAYRFALGRWAFLLGLGVLTILFLVAFWVGALLLSLELTGLLVALVGNAGWLLEILLVPAALVVAVVLSLRLQFGMPALVAEELGPGGSIRRSWDLAKGQVWHIFLVFLVVGVMFSVGADLFELLFESIAKGLGGYGGVALFDLGEGLVSLMVAPIVPIVTTLLYFDLRARRQGSISEPALPLPTPPVVRQ